MKSVGYVYLLYTFANNGVQPLRSFKTEQIQQDFKYFREKYLNNAGIDSIQQT